MPGVVAKPDHVPESLFRDFDFTDPPGSANDIHVAWKRIQDENPPAFWTPHFGGHWVVTRGADILKIQTDGDTFSHRVVSLPRDTKPVPFVPLELDQPAHTPLRQFLNPWFSPRAVRDLEPKARQLAIELIEGFAPRGRCEFLTEFAQHLPVIVFLGIVGLPLSHREMFLGWVREAAEAKDAQMRRAAFGKAGAYLSEILAARRASPGEDLLSQIATAEMGGRKLSDAEAMGMSLLVFFGGLDTVVNMLCMIARRLALHSEERRYLTENPDRIPRAIEELMRRHGITNTSRYITRDVEFAGAPFREGDIVLAPNMFIGLDDANFANPMDVDLKRAAAVHGAFGNGPHRCVGNNLARAEIRVFLEEWLKRIPDFAIEPGAEIVMRSGPVCGIEALPLIWTPRSDR